MKKLLLCFAFAVSSCKPVSIGPGTLAMGTQSSPATGQKQAVTCVLDESQESVKRLLAFQWRGVKPYLGCPFYQSEWSVYPNMALSDGSNSFELWFKNQFKTMENLSRVAGAEYFADRYEFYTVVMGEGLPFLLDAFAQIDVASGDQFTARIDDIRRKHPEPNTEKSFLAYIKDLESAYQVLLEPLKKATPNLAAMRETGRVVQPDSWRLKQLKTDPRNLPINGFGLLGVDWFGDEFARLRVQNYSRPYVGQFEVGRHFLTFKTKNERGETVTSAVFNSLETGLKAFAAVYLERRHMFVEDSRRYLGSVPTDPDARMYWTYYYFRRPAEALQKLKQSRGELYSPKQGEDGLRPPQIPMQCLKRVATRKLLIQERALE